MELLKKINEKQPVVGTFLQLGSSTAAECLALSGFDYIIIDTEHGPFSEESTLEMVRALQSRGCNAFVRAKDSSRSSLLRMLDIGADALIIPDLHSVEEAHKIVTYCKYYPMGRRGVIFARNAAFGTDKDISNLNVFFDKVNKEKWIIPQCETLGALENIEEIASIEGIDGIFVGPYDLSVALGAPAQFETDDFKGALIRVISACKKNGKIAMIFAGSPAQWKEYRELGFDIIALGTDAGFLMAHCKEIINEVLAQ